MHFPRYWALGTSGDYSCWQWSDSSALDAKSRAEASAAKIAAARATATDRRNRYDYGQRALREQIVEELPGGSEESRAVITRNSYGSLVLNTSRICFIDIDLPAEKRPAVRRSFLSMLFGGAKPDSTPKGAAETAIDRISAWFDRNPTWGGRLYRTRAGLRLLITSHFLDPNASTTEQMFGELGSDPLYYRLCKNQSSFRARLSPKPWRCDLEPPPARWPFLNSDQERRFESWKSRYEAAAAGFATCNFMQALGSASIVSGIEQALTRHDELTGANSGKSLA